MPTEIPQEKRQLIERVIDSLENLIHVADEDCLQVFNELLAPLSQHLTRCGIEITLKLNHFGRPGQSLGTDSSSEVARHRRTPRRQTQNQVATSSPSGPRVPSVGPEQQTLNREIPSLENTAPSLTNGSPRLKDRPVLVRLAIRVLRYADKFPPPEAPLSNTGTKFQNEIEGLLAAEYMAHGTSLAKLARLRRLYPLYVAELKTIQERNPKLARQGRRAVLVTSLHSRFGGARRTLTRLVSDIEIVGVIIQFYSEPPIDISDPVLLAIAMEYYGTSAKYVEERMNTLQFYTPWLTSLVSTETMIPPGFRLPAYSTLGDSTKLTRPLEPLDLEAIESRSDPWANHVQLEEKFLVICKDRLLTVITLDPKTVLGSLKPQNKLGTMRRVGGALANCRTMKRNGEEIVITYTQVDEMGELTLG
ncbi:hypothetical protein TWF718_009676 [Orbilia javanica]|uniref:Uncharacterized protein n=1 Tax=Orbilia javanica TaxID=47235 RepID=A0AAN8MQ64_9PEZI